MVKLLALLLLTICAHGVTHAQALIKWNEARVSWTAPTQCVDGSPLPDCAVTGYRVLRAGSAAATTWSVVGETTALSLLASGLAAGQNCFHVIALSATNSAPSAVACKTAVPPAPEPPGSVIVTVAVVAGLNMAPAFRILADGSRGGAVAGFVPVGTQCHGAVAFSYRGLAYRRVPRGSVSWWETKQTDRIASPCG